MTPSLRELQQAFADAVLHAATDVLAHVRDGAFPAARHLQVYRNNSFANLAEALAACYPVVHRLVGGEYFEHTADGYIRRHPPTSGNLHDFGAAFADYLGTLTSAQSLPYLSDVARLEWAWQRAYHAAESPALANDALAAVHPDDYPKLVFHLHPSVQLFESAYPCLRIWQVNQTDASDDTHVDLAEGAQRALVVRRGLDVDIEALGAGEYALLLAFAQQQPLALANERAVVADADFDLGAALNRHVAGATVARFTF
ncbi:MAG TPA: DNA-binding domain-containing protein [Burkholderiales bacterium]|nr:DNA-binding domain-containing protein [Burkholderiales bacterium]